MIVRDCKKHTVSEDELKLLLSFVEEDIHDYQRQSTAFPLLKVSVHVCIFTLCGTGRILCDTLLVPLVAMFSALTLNVHMYTCNYVYMYTVSESPSQYLIPLLDFFLRPYWVGS